MGIPIQRETALHYLSGAQESKWLGKYQEERLDLAAAQLAICFAACYDGRGLELVQLMPRIDEEAELGTDIQVEDFLVQRELDFLPAARVIVNLTELSSAMGASLHKPVFE